MNKEMKSHSTQKHFSGNTKFKSSSMKPPIAPKPNIVMTTGLERRSLENTKEIKRHNAVPSKHHDSQQYSYPSSVLIKDDDMYDDFDAQNSFEKLTPLPLEVPVGFPEKNKSQKGLLPPLNKVEIKPSYVHQSNNHLSTGNTKTGGRTMSASAKNALMVEKIRGNISYQDGFIQNSDKVRYGRSNICKENYSEIGAPVNKSMTYFNNSMPENMLENRTKHQPISLDNSALKSINQESRPSRNLYSKSSTGTVTCSCVQIEQCEHKENSLGEATSNVKRTKQKYDEIQSKEYINGCRPRPSRPNGRSSPQALDSSIDEVDSSFIKSKYNLGPSSIYISSSQSAPCSPATKPSLQKCDAIDMEEYDYYKRLSRGISRATDNINIVSKARSEIAANNTPFFLDTPVITFTLPNLSCYTDEFRSFLEKDLIEMSTLISLEAAGRLNWWAMIGASQRLWPLATTGDGNCLLHAASLGMWGFHDRLLTLRKALHEFLTRSQYRLPLWRRWRWQVAMQNRETCLVYNQEEWEAEWDSVLRLASSAPRKGANHQMSENTSSSAPDLTLNQSSLSQGMLASAECNGPIYESLEEIHVLALAHVLKRPIIVVADVTLKDMNGDPLAPIPFGGIYLPLQFPPKECQRSPLLLTYDAAHFSALVAMEINDKDAKASLPAVIPVSDCSHDLLPIQFLIDPDEDFLWGKDEFDTKVIQKLTITNHDRKGLLNEYLDIVQIPIPPNYLEAVATYGQEGGDSPESVASDQFDLDKKSSESSFDSDDGPPSLFDGSGGGPLQGKATATARAPRQLQTVVRSFGSISRSMSKKFKKNLSKLGRTGSFRKKTNFNKGFKKGRKKVHVSTNQNFILAAKIHVDRRRAYQVELIDNYLSDAKERFFRDATPISSSAQKVVDSIGKTEDLKQRDSTDHCRSDAVQCINPGCTLYGTARSSYMCSSCFNRQKEREEREYERNFTPELPSGGPSEYDHRSVSSSDATDGSVNIDHSPIMSTTKLSGGAGGGTQYGAGGTQYGAGKSKFYASLDEHSVKNATLIPSTQPFSNIKDKTLFLSNSTFFNDIPSYNLNKDLKREPSRSDLTKGKMSLCDSSNMKSSPNLNDSSPINHLNHHHHNHLLHHEKSTLKPPTHDSSAPICINEVRVKLGADGSTKIKTSQRASTLNGRRTGEATMSSPDNISSKNCLTKGCLFYGNATTNSLCSKCHNAKNKKGDSYSLDQIKFVQI